MQGPRGPANTNGADEPTQTTVSKGQPAQTAAIVNEAQPWMRMRAGECERREARGVNANEGRGVRRTKVNGRGERKRGWAKGGEAIVGAGAVVATTAVPPTPPFFT